MLGLTRLFKGIFRPFRRHIGENVGHTQAINPLCSITLITASISRLYPELKVKEI